MKAAGITEDEIAKIRLAVAVEMPERSTILLRNKRNEAIAAVLPLGKGRIIYHAGNGDVDQTNFNRVFFEYLFQTK